MKLRKVELTEKELEILDAVISEGSVFIPGDEGPKVTPQQAVSYSHKQASIISRLRHEGSVIIEVRG